jgi:hypothetical protein
MKLFFPVTFAGLLLCACGSGNDTVTSNVVPLAQLSDIQEKIFSPSCAAFSACHSSQGDAGRCNLEDGRAYSSLVRHPFSKNSTKVLVSPGHPEESFLLNKLRGDLGPDEGERMPLHNPPLSDAQIQAISDWIAAGAADD